MYVLARRRTGSGFKGCGKRAHGGAPAHRAARRCVGGRCPPGPTPSSARLSKTFEYHVRSTSPTNQPASLNQPTPRSMYSMYVQYAGATQQDGTTFPVLCCRTPTRHGFDDTGSTSYVYQTQKQAPGALSPPQKFPLTYCSTEYPYSTPFRLNAVGLVLGRPAGRTSGSLAYSGARPQADLDVPWTPALPGAGPLPEHASPSADNAESPHAACPAYPQLYVQLLAT